MPLSNDELDRFSNAVGFPVLADVANGWCQIINDTDVSLILY